MIRGGIATTLCMLAALVWAALPVEASGRSTKPLVFEIRLLDGSTISSKETKGQVVVINFWATWCGPCRTELPALDRYYRRHRDHGVKVIAVSVEADADRDKVLEATRGFAMPVAFLEASSLDSLLNGPTVPQTVVIDREGRVRRAGWSEKPYLTEVHLEAVVTPLLRAAGSGH